jgi:hypothetical protein
MRQQLLTAITSATSTLTQFAVSREIPWNESGSPLYLKNKKKIYVDEERKEQSVLFATFTGDIYQDDLITEVYLSVDAKNPPSQLDAVISKILATKFNTGIINSGVESDYTVDKQEDVLIYTFEFRINTTIS